MKSSGIKRGLAFSAVTALAVVGLPLTANAQSLNADMDSVHGDREVQLVSQSSGVATTKNDGSNTTIRLQATGTSDINTVRFQYSTDGGTVWNNIALVSSRNDNGSFSYEWDAAGVTPGAIQVRAVGHSVIDDSNHNSTRTITLENGAGATNAVSLDNGDEVGVYQSPITGADNVIVSGTASAGSTDVSIVNAFNMDFSTETLPLVAGKFKGVLDISGIGFPWNAPDELMFRAENGSDDTEAKGVYKQVITTVDAVSTGPAPTLPTDVVNVQVTVKDQKGNPMAGVQVNRIAPGFPDQDLGVTDENGQVASTQTMNDGNVTYLANQTANDYVYQPALGDVKDELSVGLVYADGLKGVSVNGPAFDRDEYDAGDLSVQVTDQTGANFDVLAALQDVTYRWKIKPFNPAVEPTETAPQLQGAETNGKFDVDLPLGEPDGTYELWASLSEGGTGHSVSERLVASYKVGEAEVTFEGANHAPSQSTATVTGKLALVDGTPLPGRKVQVNFNNGTEYDEDGNTFMADAVVASDVNPTTNASGKFEIKIEDLAETEIRTEIGGFIRVRDFTNAPFDNWDDNGAVFRHDLDFVTDQVPDGAILSVEYDNDSAGPAGDIEDIDIHLTDAFGDPLAGVQIELALDKGFFVDGYEAAAPGQYEFTPNELGTTITVSTNASGNADADVSIGRDSGFDDDGLVVQGISGEVDGVTDDDTIQWSSDNPLGVSEISLVRTPGQAAGPTPSWNDVAYDLFAKDQFGNLVRGVSIDIDCAIVLGDDDNCPTSSFTTDSDYDNGGDIWLNADEGTYTWTATADSNKLDADLVPGSDDVTDQVTEEFYDQVPTDYAISVSPSGPIAVGDVALVTTTVLDQHGNPVEGLQVDFVRTGDPSEIRFDTNEEGEAVYAFNRTTAGVETVTAVVRTSGGGGSTVLETLTTKVTFGSDEPTAILTGRSAGKRDILVANGTSDLAGHTARLFRINGYGGNRRYVRLGLTRLNANGNVAFRVKDPNGNRAIRYVVVIQNPGHKRVWTPIAKVR